MKPNVLRTAPHDCEPDQGRPRDRFAAPGAALASRLLGDGTGPLHNHLSPLEPDAAVREATRRTDSFADTPPDGAVPDHADCL